jgi:hypothetical protein
MGWPVLTLLAIVLVDYISLEHRQQAAFDLVKNYLTQHVHIAKRQQSFFLPLRFFQKPRFSWVFRREPSARRRLPAPVPRVVYQPPVPARDASARQGEFPRLPRSPRAA